MKRSVVLACAAAFGLVLAHVLDYAVAFRDPLQRAAILHATGHGFLGRAVAISVAALMVALAGTAALGFRHRGGATLSWRGAAIRLSAIQVSGFVLLEVSERVAAGARLSGLAGVLGVLGIVLQIAIACLVAALLVGVGRAAGIVAAALARPAPSQASTYRFTPIFDAGVPRLAFASARAARAPPGSPR